MLPFAEWKVSALASTSVAKNFIVSSLVPVRYWSIAVCLHLLYLVSLGVSLFVTLWPIAELKRLVRFMIRPPLHSPKSIGLQSTTRWDAWFVVTMFSSLCVGHDLIAEVAWLNMTLFSLLCIPSSNFERLGMLLLPYSALPTLHGLSSCLVLAGASPLFSIWSSKESALPTCTQFMLPCLIHLGFMSQCFRVAVVGMLWHLQVGIGGGIALAWLIVPLILGTFPFDAKHILLLLPFFPLAVNRLWISCCTCLCDSTCHLCWTWRKAFATSNWC